MKTFSLVAFLFAAPVAVAGSPDAAANSVSSRVGTALQYLVAAESGGSNGQIAPCEPPRDPAKTTEAIGRALKASKESFEADYRAYVATRSGFQSIEKTSSDAMYNNDGYSDSICAADTTAKQNVSQLLGRISAASDAIRGSCGRIIDSYNDFNKQYSGRLPKLAKYVPPTYQPNCKETRKNVKTILTLLKQAGDDCTAVVRSSEGSLDSIARLNSRLQAGCENAKQAETDWEDQKLAEHDKMDAWEKSHPVSALLCQGDPECAHIR